MIRLHQVVPWNAVVSFRFSVLLPSTGWNRTLGPIISSTCIATRGETWFVVGIDCLFFFFIIFVCDVIFSSYFLFYFVFTLDTSTNCSRFGTCSSPTKIFSILYLWFFFYELVPLDFIFVILNNENK